MGRALMVQGTVLVVGDVGDDLVIRAHDEATAASDTRASISSRPGGSAANVAAWLGSLGVATRFVGRVSAVDVERHVAALTAHGVDARIVGDRELETERVVLHVDATGERTMFVDRGANAGLLAEDVADEVWDGVSWLHLTGYTFFDEATRPVAIALLAEARRRGVATSVDPSTLSFLREVGAEAFFDWIGRPTLLVPNLDEARVLVGSRGPNIDLDALASRADHVVVTLGAMGAAYLHGTQRLQVTAPRVEVVDTTGAGDAFVAGFLATWLRDGDPQRALESGRAASERCVGRVGARPVS